jgi:predicted transcriptional regulator
MIAPTAGTLRAEVLAYIEGRAAMGACAFEVEAALGLSGNTVRPRLRELEDAGHIVKSQERRATPSGRDARVWVAKQQKRSE